MLVLSVTDMVKKCEKLPSLVESHRFFDSIVNLFLTVSCQLLLSARVQ